MKLLWPFEGAICIALSFFKNIPMDGSHKCGLLHRPVPNATSLPIAFLIFDPSTASWRGVSASGGTDALPFPCKPPENHVKSRQLRRTYPIITDDQRKQQPKPQRQKKPERGKNATAMRDKPAIQRSRHQSPVPRCAPPTLLGWPTIHSLTKALSPALSRLSLTFSRLKTRLSSCASRNFLFSSSTAPWPLLGCWTFLSTLLNSSLKRS